MKSPWTIRAIIATQGLVLLTLAGSASAASVTLPNDLSNWSCVGTCGGSPADGDVGLSPLGNPRYGAVTTAGSRELGVSPVRLEPDALDTNGSRITSPAFQATAGDRINIFFNFVTTDGSSFADYAWARMTDASDDSLVGWLFTARTRDDELNRTVPGPLVPSAEFDPNVVLTNYSGWTFNPRTPADPVEWAPLGTRCYDQGCGFTGWLESSFEVPRSGDFRDRGSQLDRRKFRYGIGLRFCKSRGERTDPHLHSHTGSQHWRDDAERIGRIGIVRGLPPPRACPFAFAFLIVDQRVLPPLVCSIGSTRACSAQTGSLQPRKNDIAE